MVQLVEFRASSEDRESVIGVLREALEAAESGRLIDVGVVGAYASDDGPEMYVRYYGEAAYATLIASVSLLNFDLHYRRIEPDDD